MWMPESSFLVTGESAGTLSSGGARPHGSFVSILEAASAGRPSVSSKFGVFNAGDNGLAAQSILPILCSQENCGWSQGLTSINLNRFPPSLLRAAYDTNKQGAGYAPQLQQQCCMNSCFRDITANVQWPDWRFSPYGPAGASQSFTCTDEIMELTEPLGGKCPTDQGYDGGAVYYPYMNDISNMDNMIFCSTGCNYGIGGCLWPQEAFPDADGTHTPQIPGPDGRPN